MNMRPNNEKDYLVTRYMVTYKMVDVGSQTKWTDKLIDE